MALRAAATSKPNPRPLLLLALLCASAGARAGAAQQQAPMKCADWAWTTCVNLGHSLQVLSLNADGGASMSSPNRFVAGRFSQDIRLPAGYSGGVIFAWYLMDTVTPDNRDPQHSEIDFEFYGNATARSILLSLNVYAQGYQNLAQFTLPWDPSEDFHTYSLDFSSRQIIWFMDGRPVRVLRRQKGQPWPTLAMQPQGSVWHSGWTPLQPNFDNGPIGAMYRNYSEQGCVAVQNALIDDAAATCPGPWDAVLPKFQVTAHQELYGKLVKADFGWDKVV